MTTVTNQRPDPSELTALYSAVGWTAYTDQPDRLVASVAGSHLVLSARDDDGRLVGLARTVSDGATICYLQDILVDPATQRIGVVLQHSGDQLPPDPGLRQFVLLTDDDEVQRAFYRSVGLVRSDEAGAHAYLRP